MKYFILTLLWLVGLKAYSQVNLNDGLIGCYPFSGNAFDLSGSSNHGTVNGAKLATDRFGVANNAYEFNGINEFIEISPKDLQINEFSYSVWVYPRRLPSRDEALFIFSVGSSAGDQDILIGNTYTNVLTGISNGSYIGLGLNVRCMTGILPKLNQWYHIVLTKDLNNYYFYVDGKLICSNPTNGKSAFYGTGQVKATIGIRNHYGQGINAIIDDVHLYNRSINQQEVEKLYQGNFPEQAESISLDRNIPSPCAGDKITIVASTSPLSVTYQWKADGLIQPSVTSDHFSYNLPESGGDYEVNISATATYTNTCFPIAPSSDEITITVKNCNIQVEQKLLHVPQVFTPNNDGQNDSWLLFNTESFPGMKIFVFNRWGEIIFHSVGYDNPWDGTYKGDVVESGIYPYKIYIDKKLIRQGTVTIIY